MGLIDVIIDGFGNSVIDVQTDRSRPTRVADWNDLAVAQIAQTTKWHFDWIAEAAQPDRRVLALLIKGSTSIQGLISLEELDKFIFVHLIENAPHNFGAKKRFRGVAANLFAWACRRSKLLGFEGMVAFDSKTKLVDHYEKELGAMRVQDSTRMYIDQQAAELLVGRCFKEFDQWNP